MSGGIMGKDWGCSRRSGSWRRTQPGVSPNTLTIQLERRQRGAGWVGGWGHLQAPWLEILEDVIMGRAGVRGGFGGLSLFMGNRLSRDAWPAQSPLLCRYSDPGFLSLPPGLRPPLRVPFIQLAFRSQ